MASTHRVRLNGAASAAVLDSLKGQNFPNARCKEVEHSWFHIEVEEGKFLIIDNDDLNTDRNHIIRSVIEKAKKGDLDAVKFLLDHSNFEFPDFKINGD